MKQSKIINEEWYTLQDIVKSKMFEWATSFWSVRKLVEFDSKHKNILQGTITGSGRGRKYHFKGENIISFISQNRPEWSNTKK
jgi:hypothetical protein